MDNIAFLMPLPVKTEVPVMPKKDSATALALPFPRSFAQLLTSAQSGTGAGDNPLADQQENPGQAVANELLMALAAVQQVVVPVDTLVNDQVKSASQTVQPAVNLEQQAGGLPLFSQEMQQNSLQSGSSLNQLVSQLLADETVAVPGLNPEEPAGEAAVLPLFANDAQPEESADLLAKAELQAKLVAVSTADNTAHPVPVVLESRQPAPAAQAQLPLEETALALELSGEANPAEAAVANQPAALSGKQEKIMDKQSAETGLSPITPIQSQSILNQSGQGDKDLSGRNDSLVPSGLTELRTVNSDRPVFETISQTAAPDQQNIIKQIVDQARLYLRPANQSTMVLQLKPEHLGEIMLKVSIDSGVVSAAFHSNNPEVRQVIEASLPQLRQDLSQQGIKLDNVSVFSGTTQFFDNGHGSAQQQQQQPVPMRRTSQEFVQAIESAEEITVTDGVDYRI